MALETTSHRRINKLSHRSGRRASAGEAALVSDAAGKLIETHEHASEFKQP
jgi:hypothetical protein